ncbi:MAG: hypothetical protein ACI31R_01335 [Bacilli bacterium]
MSKVGTSGLEAINHSADSTLQIGATEDITEYRFRGGNDVVTNNYVYFNCTDMTNQTADTCDLYRIIGIFPTDDGEGNIENRVKLIKVTSDMLHYIWSTNNWAEPATVNTNLNTTFYNSINTNYQSLIGNAKYYLGGYSSSSVKTSVMYQYERKISGSDYYYDSNPNSWTGKIALMYVSDYGYSANSTCSESTTLSNYSSTSCKNNNWLLDEDEYRWLLAHDPSTGNYILYADMDGSVGMAYSSNGVDGDDLTTFPVFYLTADANFRDGDGSQSNPYQLAK